MNRMILGSALLALGMLAGCGDKGNAGDPPAPVPQVKSVSRNRFPVGANNTLEIKLKHVTVSGTPAVTFGTAAGTVVSTTDSTIRVKAPALAPGVYAIKMTIGGKELTADSSLRIVGPRYLLAGLRLQEVVKINLMGAVNTPATVVATVSESLDGVQVAYDAGRKLLFYNSTYNIFQYNLNTNSKTDLGYVGRISTLEAWPSGNWVLAGIFGGDYSIKARGYDASGGANLYTSTEADAYYFNNLTIGADGRMYTYQTAAASPIYLRSLKLENGVVNSVTMAVVPASAISNTYAFDPSGNLIYRLARETGEPAKLYRAQIDNPTAWTLLQTFDRTTYGPLSHISAFKYEPLSGCLYLGDYNAQKLYRIDLNLTTPAVELVHQGHEYYSFAFMPE